MQSREPLINSKTHSEQEHPRGIVCGSSCDKWRGSPHLHVSTQNNYNRDNNGDDWRQLRDFVTKSFGASIHQLISLRILCGGGRSNGSSPLSSSRAAADWCNNNNNYHRLIITYLDSNSSPSLHAIHDEKIAPEPPDFQIHSSWWFFDLLHERRKTEVLIINPIRVSGQTR